MPKMIIAGTSINGNVATPAVMAKEGKGKATEEANSEKVVHTANHVTVIVKLGAQASASKKTKPATKN